MPDNGTSLKLLIKNHQNLLIKEFILKDSTAKSLQIAFSEMASGKLHKTPSKSFIKQWHELFGPEKEELNNCQKKIVQKSNEYESEKYLMFTNELIQIFSKNEGIERKEFATIINDVLETQDYGMEYYKLSVFFVFDLIATSAGVDHTVTTLKSPTDQQISNALKIEINDESKIIYQNKPIEIDQVGEILSKYYKRNKSKSILSLKTDKNAKYNVYAEVSELIRKELNQLRMELAESKFKKPFEKLNQTEMDFVNTTYPMVVIE
ncbi:hypothetical protein [uncultured Maribacter sp.]|uniref:ExbD/TolR family protein n=1 Tax=uncultured Maribacter sp. TaxID=431308 RepID=UPI00263988FF|nr:hypothetical protein [uncultured Maribacter sp.]